MKKIGVNLDSLGIFASALCMVHCLAFPVILLALPVMNLSASQPGNGSSGSAASDSACCAKEGCCELAASGGASDDQGPACCATPFDFWVHVGLLAGVAPLGVVAWGFGVRKHGRWGVLALGAGGVLLLSGALLFGHQLLDGYGEPVMTVMGSICMVSAHFWNRWQCQCCQAPGAEKVVQIENAPSSSQPVSLQS